MSPSSSARGTRAATEFDDDHLDRAGAHQRLGDLEGLLAGIGLRDQQVVHIHAAAGGIRRVEGVLHVDESHRAAHVLGLGGDVLADGGLAGRLRAVDLGNASARDAAHAQGDVERKRPGRDDVGDHLVGFTQAHDRALAVAFDDIAQGFLEHCIAGLIVGVFILLGFACHSHFSKGKFAYWHSKAV